MATFAGFNRAWTALAEAGRRDEIGGAEYRRTLAAAIQSGDVDATCGLALEPDDDEDDDDDDDDDTDEIDRIPQL